MALPMLQPTRDRFFDGGSLDNTEPPNPHAPPKIVLRRVVVPEPRRFLWWRWTAQVERFHLERRIGYRARREAGGGDDEYRVPKDPDFLTDLASVPALFTWLVPKSGLHLPAALIHDALVHDPDRNGGRQDYIGKPVRRHRADVIFRDAMGDLGTGVVRRWLMWTAVTLASVKEGVGETARVRNYYRGAVFGSLGVIAVLGILATLDLTDVSAGWRPRWLWQLPWMAERGTGLELLYGIGMAVLVPLVLAMLFWGRFRAAGVIAGMVFAVLLHVTLALLLLTGVFLAAEKVAKRWVEPQPNEPETPRTPRHRAPGAAGAPT